MHAQLQAVVDDFQAAHARLRKLAADVPRDAWLHRGDGTGWSAAQCVAHLNLTSAAFIPLLNDALRRARELGGPAPRRYRRDLLGWIVWSVVGPRVVVRTTTTKPFEPAAVEPLDDLLRTFDRLQAEQIALAERADGLPIDRVKIESPFDARAKYNTYAALTIVPRHQHRHLRQAEDACRRFRG
jgi:hypothetical protein